MKILNLSEGFDPFQTSPTEVMSREIFTFSGGEPHIKLHANCFDLKEDIVITHRIRNFNDFGLLAVAVDALREVCPEATSMISLFLPYFPGARQDRIMVPGEPFTARVYGDLINSMNFKEVMVLDPHSDVTNAVVRHCTVIPNYKFVHDVLQDIYPQVNAKTPLLVSPDAGANKKVLGLAQYLSQYNKMDIVKCDKVRDVASGAITSFEVYADDLKGQDCIIVDDICDGGGTFLGIAEELKKKNAGDLYLVVTHGIFSKGFATLNKVFKGIYMTDSINSWNPMEQMKDTLAVDSVVKVIKLNINQIL